MYRCVAVSELAFIEQLAYAYMGNGYWFYVTGIVPKRLEPWQVDQRMIDKFEPGTKGPCDGRIQYIRFEDFWVLIATHGTNQFFERNVDKKTGKPQYHDARHRAITFAGYAIRCPQGRPQVKIEMLEYRKAKKELFSIATRLPADKLVRTIKRRLNFEPFPGVQKQLFRLTHEINKKRAKSGLEPISFTQLKQQRRVTYGNRVLPSH